MPLQAALSGSYDYRLVALSVLIAMLASYAALDLGGRVTASRGSLRSIWLMGGATAMGMGIWSMHYIGMLAYNLPVAVFYNWPTVLWSLLAAMLASAVALFIVSRNEMGPLHISVGGLAMGIAIAAMHYVGMEAMLLPAICGEAKNAHEVLIQVQARNWDLVILDIAMAGRSGLDVLDDLVRVNPKLPVLVLSMLREDQFGTRALKGGAGGT
jgi:NO-binding membrane sensor protein with MHYT domain